jgi:hypothetical protein
LPIGLTVAHWSHCCPLVTVAHWSHPLYMVKNKNNKKTKISYLIISVWPTRWPKKNFVA